MNGSPLSTIVKKCTGSPSPGQVAATRRLWPSAPAPMPLIVRNNSGWVPGRAGAQRRGLGPLGGDDLEGLSDAQSSRTDRVCLSSHAIQRPAVLLKLHHRLNVPTPATRRSISDVQRYWDSRPCNIRHSPKPVGSNEYFDEVEARKYFVEPHIPSFAEFDRWNGKRVLEVGCGIGTDSINFARAGADLTAVDLSGESLRVARQRATAMGVADRIRFVQANAEELTSTLGTEPYDLVYSFGVVH